MISPREDWFYFGLVLSWPFFLAAGVGLWLQGVPFAWFFLGYCSTSVVGVFAVARDFWHHGIHNDR